MLLERICHVMNQVLFTQPPKLDPPGFYPDGQGQPLNRGHGTHTLEQRGPKDCSCFPGPLVFQRILQHCRTGFQCFSIHSTVRTDATLRSHHLDVREYHPEFADCYNRFCPGSVDFRQDQMQFCSPGFPRNKWNPQCLFFDLTRVVSLRTRGPTGHNCSPRPHRGVPEFCQPRQTDSSKLLWLGLLVSSLTMQSNSDCCAAAHG